MDFGHPENNEKNRFPDDKPILDLIDDGIESFNESNDEQDDFNIKSQKQPSKKGKSLSLKPEKKIQLEKIEDDRIIDLLYKKGSDLQQLKEQMTIAHERVN